MTSMISAPRVGWIRVGRNGTSTKPPVNERGVIDATRPENWRTRAQIQQLIAEGRALGEGIPLGHGLAGLDLDHALAANGALLEWATPFVFPFLCSTWVERSPSGRGLHVLGRAQLPRNCVKTGLGPDGAGRAELFTHSKFFTLTYDQWPGSAADFGDVQATFNEIFAALTNDPKAPQSPTSHKEKKPLLPDDVVLLQAGEAYNGPKFKSLFEAGELSAYHGDHSRADAALATMLCFWSDDDAQVARLFGQSALAKREKWQRRPEYRERTLAWARRVVAREQH